MKRVREWAPALRRLRRSGSSLWEGGTRGFDVQRFLLPPLSDILETLWEEGDTLWRAGFFTFKEALGGFVIGSGLGILLRAAARALPAARQRR